jgi:methyl-accepting chemotaxis protein
MMQRFNLSARVALGYIFVLTSLVVVAAGGVLELRSASQGFGAFSHSSKDAIRLLSVDRSVAAIRPNVENFAQKGDDASLARIREIQSSLSQNLKSALDEEADPSSKAAITQLIEIIGAYFADFDKMSEARKSIGTLPENGSQGALRKSVHAIEEKTKAAKAQGLSILMLTMRRHEKDFLLRGDAKYIASLTETAKAFGDALEVSTFSSEEKDATKVLLASYVKDFTDLANASLTVKKLVEESLNPKGVEFAKKVSEAVGAKKQAMETIDAETAGGIAFGIKLSSMLGIAATLLGALLSFLISRSIVLPLKSMTQVMMRLAGGDKSVEIPALGNTDEVGDMARAVLVFKDNMIKAERLAAEQAAHGQEQVSRAKHIQQAAEVFDATISATISEASGAAERLATTAEGMSAIAAQTNQQAADVASASEEALRSVETVAAASEQLSSSISEISRQVTQSAQVARTAAEEASHANEMVQSLAEAANKIGEVVNLINDIASQTNLLALNATIEAARAGEAGKGFAVVANEVKGLANQTAKATGEISQQISSVQKATDEAVAAIAGIAKVIGNVNEISSSIASAVEEQGAATQEIARNAQMASSATTKVTSLIPAITQGAAETGQAARHVLESSGELTRQSGNLRGGVDSFLKNIKSG